MIYQLINVQFTPRIIYVIYLLVMTINIIRCTYTYLINLKKQMYLFINFTVGLLLRILNFESFSFFPVVTKILISFKTSLMSRLPSSGAWSRCKPCWSEEGTTTTTPPASSSIPGLGHSSEECLSSLLINRSD